MPPSKHIICVARGTDIIDKAIPQLNESQVQLLYCKFPVGSGTFKRNKFIYVEFSGPQCGIVKRGRAIGEIKTFAENLDGAAGFSTTEKSTLSFGYLVERMRPVFITDNGTFSLQAIHDEYTRRLAEEQRKMHFDESTRAASDSGAMDDSVSFQNDEYFFGSSTPKPTETGELEAALVKAIHDDVSPVNWATFESNAKKLTVSDYGDGGIFEMVNSLDPTKWLFGLFRMSIGTGDDRQTRVIFFQWIGDQLRVVRRERSSVLVYQRIAEVLSPHSMQIFLVGKGDLNPKSIIDKTVSAFLEPDNSPGSQTIANKRTELKHINPTEEEYKNSLKEEQKIVPRSHEFFIVRKKYADKHPQHGVEKAPKHDITRKFDVSETLRLMHQSEGGLSWAIFQVE